MGGFLRLDRKKYANVKYLSMQKTDWLILEADIR